MSNKQLHETPLKKTRRARALSQADLARIARVSQQTISKAERGALSLTPDLQELIATILGTPRKDLFPSGDAAESQVPA